MKSLLVCPGIRIAGFAIPPFEVVERDFVAMRDPSYYGEDQYALMHALGGIENRLQLSGKVVVVSPWPLHAPEQEMGDKWLPDYMACRGVSGERAERIMADLGLKPNERCCELQLTPRLLLDLQLAREQRAEVVVFATGGLDPAGVAAVRSEVSATLEHCAAIEFLAANLFDEAATAFTFTKTVRCELVEQ